MDISDPDFDMAAYIERRLAEALADDPAIRRETARILYGTRAVKQPASAHTRSRRDKRRARKR